MWPVYVASVWGQCMGPVYAASAGERGQRGSGLGAVAREGLLPHGGPGLVR